MARSLRLRDARNIGIVVPDIGNSFFASVIKGAQICCRRRGYTLMVCNSEESARLEDESLRMLLEKQISGLILASVGGGEELLLQYAKLNVPIVFIDNVPSGAQARDLVSIDNRLAARRITGAMIARGYRRIGMITGPLHQSTGILRYQGFADALEEAGIPLRREWVLEGDFRMESGRVCMEALVHMEDRPRAMIVANNYMTYGAVNAVRRAGLRIPEDIAVAAFDAHDETGLITPLITSINQPRAGDWPARGADHPGSAGRRGRDGASPGHSRAGDGRGRLLVGAERITPGAIRENIEGRKNMKKLLVTLLAVSSPLARWMAARLPRPRSA